MQLIQGGQEGNGTVSSQQIPVLDVCGLVNVIVAQRIKLGGLLIVFLGKPNLVGTENLLVQQMRFVGGKDELSFQVLIFGKLAYHFFDENRMNAPFHFVYDKDNGEMQYQIENRHVFYHAHGAVRLTLK